MSEVNSIVAAIKNEFATVGVIQAAIKDQQVSRESAALACVIQTLAYLKATNAPPVKQRKASGVAMRELLELIEIPESRFNAYWKSARAMQFHTDFKEIAHNPNKVSDLLEAGFNDSGKIETHKGLRTALGLIQKPTLVGDLVALCVKYGIE